MLQDYHKFPKYSDNQKTCCNHSKTMWLYHRVISPNDADGMANSVDPDQTVWSGSALFAQAYLSENLDHYGTHIFKTIKSDWMLNEPVPIQCQSPRNDNKKVMPNPSTFFFSDCNMFYLTYYYFFSYLGFTAGQNYFTHFEPSQS